MVLSDQLVDADRAAFERVVMQVVGSGARMIEVDFKDLTYMDSAGLGLLLTLREQAEKARAKVILANPKGSVREILELARFDTLFSIQHAP
nr:STAS domain-containing protein [Roseospira visakhapatnamensis]